MRRRVEATVRDVMEAFALMGISDPVAKRFFDAQSAGAARAALDDAKVEAKATWKRLAFDLHPDRNGGNDEEFKRVKEVFESLIRLDVSVRQPVQVMQVQVVRVNVSNWNAAPTTSGTSWY